MPISKNNQYQSGYGSECGDRIGSDTTKPLSWAIEFPEYVMTRAP